MQTRQQQDALRALEDVQKILEEAETKEKGKREEFKKSYAIAVHRFPFLVRQNGLQQTLAFYAGKAYAKDESGTEPQNTAEGKFLDHISKKLNLSGTNHADILQELAKTDLQSYMRHTRRCLELALWYRRFVESVLKVDATGNIAPENDNNKEAGDDVPDATNSPS
jgi:CRISPR-associated protein Cmr5